MARGKYQKKKRFNGGLTVVIILALLFVLLATLLLLNSCDTADVPDGDHTGASRKPSSQQSTAPSDSVPQTTPTTTGPTEPYVVASATVGASGDFLMHKPVMDACLTNGDYDFAELFTYVKDYYSGYDFMVVNLETTLGGTAAGQYIGYPLFNCPDDIIDGLKDAGVDLVLTANNHTYDTGHNGFIRTQEVIEEKGLLHLGTKLSEDIPNYIVQDLNGIKVGMVCYTYETGDTSDGRKTLNGVPVAASDTDLLNSFNYSELDEFYSELEESIAAMEAEGAQATMIFIHWGNEYYLQENNSQNSIAQALCELGFDVIVGGHPHVIEPFETLTSSTGHETYCIYSVGNAVSNQNRTSLANTTHNAIYTEDGMIFSVEFEMWNDGSVNVADINIIPTWVSKQYRNGQYDYNIIPLDTAIEVWDCFGVPAESETYSSYKRTLTIIGDGLNAFKEAKGLTTVPTEHTAP